MARLRRSRIQGSLRVCAPFSVACLRCWSSCTLAEDATQTIPSQCFTVSFKATIWTIGICPFFVVAIVLLH